MRTMRSLHWRLLIFAIHGLAVIPVFAFVLWLSPRQRVQPIPAESSEKKILAILEDVNLNEPIERIETPATPRRHETRLQSTEAVPNK